MKTSEKVCHFCGEKNNPSFTQCWKCHGLFDDAQVSPEFKNNILANMKLRENDHDQQSLKKIKKIVAISWISHIVYVGLLIVFIKTTAGPNGMNYLIEGFLLMLIEFIIFLWLAVSTCMLARMLGLRLFTLILICFITFLPTLVGQLIAPLLLLKISKRSPKGGKTSIVS